MRRAVPAVLAAGAVLLPGATVAVGAGSTGARATEQARPNVVVIMTDDQTVESIARHDERRGASSRDRGATFANSFVGYRALLPVARHLPHRAVRPQPRRARKRAADGRLRKARPHEHAARSGSRTAGYYTAHLGKYLNGYGRSDPREIPPGCDEWRGSVDPSTYRYFGYTLNENGRLVTYERRYQTDVYAAEGRRTSSSAARPLEQPFFLSVAFLAPHSGGPREPDDPVRHGHARARAAAPERLRRRAAPAAARRSTRRTSPTSRSDIRNRPLLTPARMPQDP